MRRGAPDALPISNLRSVFIGFLGARYGAGLCEGENAWLRAQIEVAVANGHPWLTGYEQTSITEMEYQYGFVRTESGFTPDLLKRAACVLWRGERP